MAHFIDGPFQLLDDPLGAHDYFPPGWVNNFVLGLPRPATPEAEVVEITSDDEDEDVASEEEIPGMRMTCTHASRLLI